MSNLDDIDLQPSTSHDFDLRTPGATRPAREGRRPSVWVALAILVALIGGVAYFIYGRQPLPPEQAAESRPARSQAPPAPPAEPLPALDASDALIRQLVASFSSHPQLASWLATPDLVRTFVAIVDKIAIGASPGEERGVRAAESGRSQVARLGRDGADLAGELRPLQHASPA